MTGGVEVIKVLTSRQMDAFIHVVDGIYKDCQQYVPDLENEVPHSVSMTRETFRVDTPLTTISAIPATSAASLRE